MGQSAKDRKDALVAAFLRKGGLRPRTMPFESLPLEQQDQLHSAVEFGTDELPVVASFGESGTWLLVTTSRVVWKSVSGRVQSLSGDLIEGVSVDLQAESSAGATGRGDLRFLNIKAADGAHLVEIEPGPLQTGLMAVLRQRKRGQA